MIIKVAIVALVCYVLYRLFMNDNKKRLKKKPKRKRSA